jgi:hypothetical protein
MESRLLSADEVAQLANDEGHPAYVEVAVGDTGTAGTPRRHLTLRVKGITGTFAAARFTGVIRGTDPGRCVVETTVVMPNNRTHHLGSMAVSGEVMNPVTTQLAYAYVVGRALAWASLFSDGPVAELVKAGEWLARRARADAGLAVDASAVVSAAARVGQVTVPPIRD